MQAPELLGCVGVGVGAGVGCVGVGVEWESERVPEYATVNHSTFLIAFCLCRLHLFVQGVRQLRA